MKVLTCCPNCHKEAKFMPEQMPCDGSLVLWCEKCGNYVSLTTTIQTYRNWWDRYDKGETEEKPPISMATIRELNSLQDRVNIVLKDLIGGKATIHIQDFQEFQEVDDA